MIRLRLWPRSLLGQMLLAVALALLVAQAISLTLLVRAQEQRREELLINGIAFRLVAAPRNERELLPPPEAGQTEPPPRLGLDRVHRLAPLAVDRRDPGRENHLRDVLDRQGFSVADLRVYVRPLSADPRALARLERRTALRDRPRLKTAELLVAAMQPNAGSEWTVARLPIPAREASGLWAIIGQTLVLYAVLVGGLALLLRRITRPLNALTRRLAEFAQTRELDGQLEPDGPEDTRRLIEAHNAMEARIASLLDEKDVMLGAIGHDLKTPLAALRVRIETVEDPAERDKMAATIEDITRTLDDILSLARVGRPSDPLEPTDLAALAAGVVEEFEDLGEPVTLAEGGRIALPVRATWLRRALRNLVVNALRYGSTARVALERRAGEVVLRVEDDGPGIPDGEIAGMLEPFRRGEASRNKATGGAGLGLTLARAIAEQHGGSLQLANRRDAGGKVTGLAAEIRLPAG